MLTADDSELGREFGCQCIVSGYDKIGNVLIRLDRHLDALTGFVGLAGALEALHTKRELRPPKKHGLIPL